MQFYLDRCFHISIDRNFLFGPSHITYMPRHYVAMNPRFSTHDVVLGLSIIPYAHDMSKILGGVPSPPQ